MDGNLIGLAAVTLPFAVAALAMWTRHREKAMGHQATLAADKAAQYAQHTQALEERVRVLERIVTDSGYSLSHEIESLRGEDSERRIAAPRTPAARAKHKAGQEAG